MLLSELLGLPVNDSGSRKLGTVVDVRLAAPPDDHQQTPTHVAGLVISPHTRSNYLGYERTRVQAPWLLARSCGGGTAKPLWSLGLTSPASRRPASRCVQISAGTHLS